MPVPGGPWRQSENARCWPPTSWSASSMRSRLAVVSSGSNAGIVTDTTGTDAGHRAHDATRSPLDGGGATAGELRGADRVLDDRGRSVEMLRQALDIRRVDLDAIALQELLHDAATLGGRGPLQLGGDRHAAEQRRIHIAELVGGPQDGDRVGFQQAIEVDLGAAAADEMQRDVLHLVEQQRGMLSRRPADVGRTRDRPGGRRGRSRARRPALRQPRRAIHRQRRRQPWPARSCPIQAVRTAGD